MLFSAGLISGLLFLPAVQVMAYPLNHHDEYRGSQLLTRGNDQSILYAGVEYWGDGKGTFTKMNATFNVPQVENLRHPFSVKIGLDGVHCRDAYIHAGVEITPGKDGEASYRGYYLWHPSSKGYFDQVSVSAGHDVTFSVDVTLTPETTAIITVTDEHTGISAGVYIQDPSANAICAEDAALLVQPDNHLIPIANFGTVVFKNIYLPNANQYAGHLEGLVQNLRETARTTQEGETFEVHYV